MLIRMYPKFVSSRLLWMLGVDAVLKEIGKAAAAALVSWSARLYYKSQTQLFVSNQESLEASRVEH